MKSKYILKVGRRFHRLTVLRRLEEHKSPCLTRWECRCVCGTKTTVRADRLVNGYTKSCRCLARELRRIHMHPGDRYARLTVLSEAGKNSDGRITWKCRCICGNTSVVTGQALKAGTTRSCGCLMRETTGKRATVHGQSKSPEYSVYQAMKARCCNAKNIKYSRYGGRGISIDPRWLNSFTTFRKDVGPRPSLKHSLERKDNDGNYEPGNVRWATQKEQMRNTSRNRRVTINGVAKVISEWARHFHIILTTVYSRMSRGWSPVKALTTPLLRIGNRGPRRRRSNG